MMSVIDDVDDVVDTTTEIFENLNNHKTSIRISEIRSLIVGFSFIETCRGCRKYSPRINECINHAHYILYIKLNIIIHYAHLLDQ